MSPACIVEEEEEQGEGEREGRDRQHRAGVCCLLVHHHDVHSRNLVITGTVVERPVFILQSSRCNLASPVPQEGLLAYLGQRVT